MYQLGVAVKILGRALRVRDARTAANQPHLSVSLAYLLEIFQYLRRIGVRCYRIAADLTPRHISASARDFERQIDESRAMFDAVRAFAAQSCIRLTIHAGMDVALGASDERIVERSLLALTRYARIFDELQCGPDSVIVVHAGGDQADLAQTRHRFACCIERLASHVRDRIVLEPDGAFIELGDALRVHALTGIPIVFDTLHHQLANRDNISLSVALALALATWPIDRRPKVHFSTQRTEAHVLTDQRVGVRVVAPLRGQHADFLNPHEFIHFLRAARGSRPFDIMLEAKAADLALLRLREDVGYYARDLARELG